MRRFCHDTFLCGIIDHYCVSMLHQSIKDEVKKAMRERDAVRLNALRNILAAVTNELVAKRRKPDETLEDEGVITVIGRLIKQRKESIEHFKKEAAKSLLAKKPRNSRILKHTCRR